MKIKNLNICNSKIRFKNINIDISNYGIYVLIGENGSGKTSLLENIIFENNHISFNNELHTASYNKDRYNLISYLPQNIIATNDSVIDYVFKNKKEANIDNLTKLMEKFNMSDIQLNQSVRNLSGGELSKLSIISVLLKDTPYIFLDEPTNNLDNTSVNNFLDIIKEYSKNHTIIMVCHDNRIPIDTYNLLQIKDNHIKILKNTSISLNNGKVATHNLSIMRLLKKFLNNKNNYILVFSLFMIFIYLIFFMNEQFRRNYSVDELYPYENVILTYKAEYAYGELNRVYTQSQNLKIDTKSYYNLISYDDVKKIAEIDGIKNLILYDYEFWEDIFIKRDTNSLTSKELSIVSIPEEVYNFKNEFAFLVQDLCSLTTGRYPVNNANEISISSNILKQHYNYSETQIEEAIGNNILYNNIEYTIVGITQYDICIMSYHNGVNLGFYNYNENNYGIFKKRNVNYKKSVDGAISDVDNLIILTDKGKEKDVLNTIIQMYPAENYDSNFYQKEWIKQFNANFIIKIFLINIVISSFLGIIYIFLNKNQFIIDRNKISDLENYYIARKKIKVIYYTQMILLYLIIAAIAIFANSIITSFYYITNYIFIIDMLVILLPSIVLAIWRINRC